MKKSILITLVGYIAVALLLLSVFPVGEITARELGIGYVSLFLFGVVVLTVVIQQSARSRNDSAIVTTTGTKERESSRQSARSYMAAVVVMCAILIYGLWDSHSYPLWITLIGALINIGIICVLLIAVRNKMRIANSGDSSRPK